MSEDVIDIKIKHTHKDDIPKKSVDRDIKILGQSVAKKKNFKGTIGKRT
jgi:hypothetical protein